MNEGKIDESIYNLFLILGSLNPLKIRIITILSHIFPERISATQLTYLLGYSKNSRIVYRGVLDELENEEFLVIDKITKKKFSLQLNKNHPAMNLLIEMCFIHGEDTATNYFDILRDIK